MEVDEIEDDLHPQFVRLRAEVFKILVRAVLLVDVEVVGNAVLILRIVEPAFDLPRTPERPVRVSIHLEDRHKIRDGDAEILEVRELPLRRLERAFRGERARLDLVHHAAREPPRRLARVLHVRIRAERTVRRSQHYSKNCSAVYFHSRHPVAKSRCDQYQRYIEGPVRAHPPSANETKSLACPFHLGFRTMR